MQIDLRSLRKSLDSIHKAKLLKNPNDLNYNQNVSNIPESDSEAFTPIDTSTRNRDGIDDTQDLLKPKYD